MRIALVSVLLLGSACGNNGDAPPSTIAGAGPTTLLVDQETDRVVASAPDSHGAVQVTIQWSITNEGDEPIDRRELPSVVLLDEEINVWRPQWSDLDTVTVGGSERSHRLEAGARQTTTASLRVPVDLWRKGCWLKSWDPPPPAGGFPIICVNQPGQADSITDRS